MFNQQTNFTFSFLTQKPANLSPKIRGCVQKLWRNKTNKLSGPEKISFSQCKHSWL